ncbi:hypothetical protein G3N95_24345 [Paraburkholderia sp. Tr-20389]|uniref:hypothetical protein n=1 Tax=Paraburkholderia sp. Tr-20389 TaxID=2703903 RepID=UPI001980D8D0|nr:hypothetical protein [Paraburkholderia sp. Tr-20389]MBN3756093.1 hypothetical protein [Paraburkholderia sp. Tr-20389]
MKEYEVTVYIPGGGVYFRTTWMEGLVKAEGIAAELSGVYGSEAVELVERTMTRVGTTFRTIRHAEVWKA